MTTARAAIPLNHQESQNAVSFLKGPDFVLLLSSILNDGEMPNNEPLTQGLSTMATEVLKLGTKPLKSLVA